MLRSLNTIWGSSIIAVDGALGSVTDFLVERLSWKVAYFTVRTGWPSPEEVLLSPHVMRRSEWSRKLFETCLSLEQVRGEQGDYEAPPVPHLFNQLRLSDRHRADDPLEHSATANPGLQSCLHLASCQIVVRGEDPREIEDFVFDDQTWMIRIIMARGHGKFGTHVLMLPTDDLCGVTWIGQHHK